MLGRNLGHAIDLGVHERDRRVEDFVHVRSAWRCVVIDAVPAELMHCFKAMHAHAPLRVFYHEHTNQRKALRQRGEQAEGLEHRATCAARQ